MHTEYVANGSAVALGYHTSAGTSGGIAIGSNASASGNAAIALGFGAVATTKTLAVGNPSDSNLAIADSYFGSSITSANPQSHTIHASGGSGTDIAGANLTLAGGRGTGAGAGGYIAFQTASAGSSGTTLRTLSERMRITSTGNVGIATTSPWRTLSVAGTVGFDGLTGSTGAGSLCLSADNEVVYNDGADACLPSLRQTKQDIEALSLEGLATVDALQPVSFAYKQDNDRQRFGFIAEDVADVAAPLATYDASSSLSGIDDRAILAVVVQALKELWAYVTERFASHDREIRRLKARVSELESRLNIQPPAPPGSSQPESAPEEAEVTDEEEEPERSSDEENKEATSTPELSEVESPSIIPEDNETDKQVQGETSDEADDEPLREQPQDSGASADSASDSEQTDTEHTAQEAEDIDTPSLSPAAVDTDKTESNR